MFNTQIASGIVIRWGPVTGSVERWTTGLTAPNGIAIAPNGDIYLADPGAGNVYRICPGRDPAKQRRAYHDRGHGNNADHDDEDNPGRGRGDHGTDPSRDDDGTDDDER